MTDPKATRAELATKLVDVLRRSGRIEAHLRNADRELSDDFADRISETENDQVLELLDERTRAEVVAIRAAIARIDAGTWATCSKCKKAIDARRLAAMPTTTLCVACAAQA